MVSVSRKSIDWFKPGRSKSWIPKQLQAALCAANVPMTPGNAAVRTFWCHN